MALYFENAHGINGIYEGPDYAMVRDWPDGIVIYQNPGFPSDLPYNLHDPAALARPRRG